MIADETLILLPASGFTSGIGHYLSALEEVREQLREALSDMTNEQIGRRAVEGAEPALFRPNRVLRKAPRKGRCR